MKTGFLFLVCKEREKRNKSEFVTKSIGIINPCAQVPFRFFDKSKNEIQYSILRFCFCFNKEEEIQVTDYHFHV